MPVHNADIAAVFEEIADRLEIQGASPFRIRAYRNAARTLGELPQEARALLEKGEDRRRLPGIGEDLAAKVSEIVDTGRSSLLERLRRELPPLVTELLHIPGLGPKRVKALYHDLEVQTVEQLYRAARDGRIRALPGFGEKTELNILRAVEAHATDRGRSRHPGHRGRKQGGHPALFGLRRSRRGAVSRLHPRQRRPQERSAGRSARGGRSELRRGAGVFHRFQGS